MHQEFVLATTVELEGNSFLRKARIIPGGIESCLKIKIPGQKRCVLVDNTLDRLTKLKSHCLALLKKAGS